jgi:hypothetical protein
MKILSWIVPAAAVITAAWATTVPPFDNSASDSLEDGVPLASQPASVSTRDVTPRGTTATLAADNKVKRVTFSFATYQRCRQHIDQDFQRLKTVQQVALECHSSVDSLRRNFQRYAHQTPDQYLSKVKLLHAAESRRPKNETL